MQNDLPPLPDGFKRCSGKRAPSGGKWHIQLRCGFTDTRIGYEPQQLRWVWEGHAGDVVAVRNAADDNVRAAWNPKSGGY